MRKLSDNWPAYKVEELRRLWGEGYSNSAIAREFCMSRNAILGKVKRLGLPPHDVVVRGKCSRAEAGLPRKKVKVDSTAAVEPVVEKRRFKKVIASKTERTKSDLRNMLADAVRNTVAPK